MVKVSLEKDKIKFLLIEGVHQEAADNLRAIGYANIESHKGAPDSKQLKASIRDAHFIGLCSRTRLTEEILVATERLVAVGCFCIGTNQIDLGATAKRGTLAFSAPFSNTRSVAELVIDEPLLPLRGAPGANARAHRDVWSKLAAGSSRVRDRRLRIISYGHIGTRLGILAGSLGIHVFFYNIENKLPLDSTIQVQHLSNLLNVSGVVSLYVPESASIRNMMDAEELALMKSGVLLINVSHGTVVSIPALCDALASKHLVRAAIDVSPTGPAANSDPFISPPRGFGNVILAPHIGSSTQEAQKSVDLGVAGKLAKYSDNGSTLSTVNFPEVSLPLHGGRHLLHIHGNRPSALTVISQVFIMQSTSIVAQYLQTSPQMGYVVTDIETEEDIAQQALQAMKAIPGIIHTRLLF